MPWILIPTSLGVIGVVLVAQGVHGQRVDQHPRCRRCRYDLSGGERGAGACPECGADLAPRGAVKVGRRRRRRGLLATGGLVLLLAGGMETAILWSRARNVQWRALAPMWLLAREARGAGAGRARSALSEITRRLRRDELTAGEAKPLIEEALAVQGDAARPWRVEWGDLLEAAADLDLVSEVQWRRYARQGVQLRLELRPAARAGDPLPRALMIERRVGTDPDFWLLAQLTEEQVDRTPIASSPPRRAAMVLRAGRDPRRRSVLPFGLPDAAEPAGAGPGGLEVEPGLHTLRCRWHLEVRDGRAVRERLQARGAAAEPSGPASRWEAWAGSDEGRLAGWSQWLEATFVVKPRGAETIGLIRDPALREAVRRSIHVTAFVREVGPARWITGGRVAFEDPPVPCAFEVWWRIGAREISLGRVASTGRRGRQSGSPTEDYGGAILAVPPPTVELVLRPSRDAAARTLRFGRIWGERVVVSGVPVQRVGTAPGHATPAGVRP